MTEIRHHPDGLEFKYKFPIITKQVGLGPMTDGHIKRIILENGDEQSKKTNVKALMTNWFMHKKHSVFKEICQQAIDLAMEHSPHDINWSAFDCWGSISKKGEWTKTHDHWPHPWSFVYYSDVSEGCSPLHFPNTTSAGGGYSVQPEKGELVMFPGWLYHGTMPQLVDFERVIVAGNLVYKV
ncbi:MAG: hypothetical protein VX478_02720 [Chloroflexota bacterium]|nr:hypothetical protein [Chloroflexota bacterium]